MSEGTREVFFKVRGEPVAKGSVSAFPVQRKDGRVGTVVVHSKRSKSWEALVREQVPEQVEKFEGPVEVEVVFFLRRPKSVSREFPCVRRRDDLDKLVRAVLDSLTGILYQDDGQVVNLIARKRYEEGGFVGAIIQVRAAGFPAS